MKRVVEDGFVVLPELCDSAFVDHVLKVCQERARKVRAALGEKAIGIGSAAGYREIVQRSPGRWDVPISPELFGIESSEMPWWPLVTALLGNDAEDSFSGVVFSESETPAQCWHVDSPHEDPAHRPAHAINVLLALHDTPLDMGPTELARGSHRLTNHLSNPDLVRDQLVYQHESTSPEGLATADDELPECWTAALASGTCLVFDDRILHRGLANCTQRTRHVAYFCYRRKNYGENTHFESQRSVFDPPSEPGP